MIIGRFHNRRNRTNEDSLFKTIKIMEEENLIRSAIAEASFLLGREYPADEILQRIEKNYSDVKGAVETVQKILLGLKEEGESFTRGPTVVDRIARDQLKRMFEKKEGEK